MEIENLTPEKVELLKQIFDRPIAYHKIFAKFVGVTGAVMLSQAIYWDKNKETQKRDSWFYKTQEDWEEETGLSRFEQEGARKKFKKYGFLEEKLVGIPAQLWYKVNWFNILNSLEGNRQVCGKVANLNEENQHTGMRKSSKHTIHRLPIDYSHSVNTEKKKEDREIPKTQEESQFAILQRKNRELQEKKALRKARKSLKKQNPFISDYEIEKRLGVESSLNVPQITPISPEFQNYIDKFNKRFKSRFKATPAGQKLWDYWLNYYSIEEIQASTIVAMTDDWWANNFTPVLFFRTKNEGRDIDNIGKFLIRKVEAGSLESRLKKDILESTNE